MEPAVQTPPAAASAQAPAPAQQQQQPPAQQPASQTPPAQQSGASQTPPAQQGDKDKVVPITALHEEREKRQQIQAELEKIKQIVGGNLLYDANGNIVGVNPQQQQPVQQQQQNQYAEQIEKLWETDPRQAVRMEIMTAMSWRDQVDAEVERQAAEAGRRYGIDFNNMRAEVMAYVRSLPIEQRPQKGMVDAAYYMLRGQRVDDIITRTRQEIEADFLRKLQAGELAQSLPGGASPVNPTPQGAIQLTDEEKKVAAAMRMTEAEYAKYKKAR